MDFFTVWWYDLLLALAILPQVLHFFLSDARLEFLPWLSVVFQLASIVALPFIGCELEGVLVVLMIFAAVSSGFAFLETRLGDAKAKRAEKEVQTP